MARYIYADALGIGKAKREAFTHPEYADGWNSAIDIIDNAPTADVVPRSEVDKIFEEIGKILYEYDKTAERDKSEYGELIVGDIGYAISELKKKYTEGKDG